MAGAEAVEEMEERHARTDGCQMRHAAQVHHFLHAAGSQHGKAGLAAGHHIAVIAEDVQRMRGQRAGGNMDHAGQQFARDLIHVRDHQQQTLRSSIGGRQRTGGKRAVYRAGSAGFRLHFNHFYLMAKNVLFPLRRPFVYIFRHRRAGRDRVNRRYFGKSVGNIRRGFVTVHRFHQFCHMRPSCMILG